MSNVGNYNIQTVGGSEFSALNANNFQGYVAYPYASRNQNMGKTGVTWQVTQKLDVGVNGRYAYDNYDATLGVQNGHSAGVNVDSTYTYAENSSISAYWNWQTGQRNLRNGAAASNNISASVAPFGIWNNQLEDNSHSFGLLSRRDGLLGGKLELIGDLSYSLDTSAYSTQLFYTPTSGTPPAAVNCGSSSQLTCGNLSPIKNELMSFKFTSNYKVNKNRKLSLAYRYQKLNSNDYFYNGQQFGTTPTTLMPTGLQMQNYAVNIVALSYNLAF